MSVAHLDRTFELRNTFTSRLVLTDMRIFRRQWQRDGYRNQSKLSEIQLRGAYSELINKCNMMTKMIISYMKK